MRERKSPRTRAWNGCGAGACEPSAETAPPFSPCAAMESGPSAFAGFWFRRSDHAFFFGGGFLLLKLRVLGIFRVFFALVLVRSCLVARSP